MHLDLAKVDVDLLVDFDALTGAGSMMGPSGKTMMDHTTCMVDVARYFVRLLLDTSTQSA